MIAARRYTKAFTLVELLIVVAIIAVLIAILLPSLAAARESAKRVTCLSNLRQMVTAANSYVTDYSGAYPIAQYSVSNGTTATAYAWDLTTISNPQDPGHPTVVPGLLWGGTGTMKIQQCPSFEGAANWSGNPYTGYNYNTSYIGHGQDEFGQQDANGIVPPAKVQQIPNPADTAIFGDGQYAAGANKFMRAPWPHPNDEGEGTGIRTAGTQGFRHRRQTNVAFCDGHADSLRTRCTQNEEGAGRVAPGTGFLCNDNSVYGSASPVVDGWCDN